MDIHILTIFYTLQQQTALPASMISSHAMNIFADYVTGEPY